MTALFADRYDNLRHAATIAPNGIAVEFGVHSGRTLTVIRQHHKGKVIGFDSFEGLPETWRPGFEQGHFAAGTIPAVDGTVIVVGLFNDTVPKVFAHLDEPLTLVHFDADLYSSTAFTLEAVTPYLGERSIFVFDELVNYPGWQHHEHRAYREWLAAHPNFITREISRVPSHQQVTYEIIRK
jgi:hypothetical protein